MTPEEDTRPSIPIVVGPETGSEPPRPPSGRPSAPGALSSIIPKMPAAPVIMTPAPAPTVTLVPNAPEGGAQVLTIAPGAAAVTVATQEPRVVTQVIASFVDVAAVVVVGGLIYAGRVSVLEGLACIFAIVMARMSPSKPGGAPSAVLTLATGWLELQKARTPPPAPAALPPNQLGTAESTMAARGGASSP